MKKEFKEGQKVRAKKRITEGGRGFPGDPEAPDLWDQNWIHAEPGDVGEVIYVDHKQDDLPTVRFERTGTASLVFPAEVEVVE